MIRQLLHYVNKFLKLPILIFAFFSIRLMPYLVEQYLISNGLKYVQIKKSDITSSFIFGCIFGLIFFFVKFRPLIKDDK
jgi:hypothetical protein